MRDRAAARQAVLPRDGSHSIDRKPTTRARTINAIRRPNRAASAVRSSEGSYTLEYW